jgi:hypothetical protein
MRGAEVRAVGELAGQALSGTGALVRDVHAAIAQRAFEATGPNSATARAIHDGVSAAVYGGVRAALGALPRGAGTALALRAPANAPSLADSPRGALALAVLNGYAGDALAARDSELALRMALRHRGADVDPEAPAVPDAATRLAIFVHGLGETDAADPLGTMVGDVLVRVPSASGAGRRRRIPFGPDDGGRLGGLTHFDLLNHPAVYEQIRAWLAR